MNIAVIGGGPGGMMAAIAAAQNGGRVVLFEKNEKLGKKLYISGKGRCNVTNACSPRDFLSEVVSNAKFVQGAIHKFTPQDTVAFCNAHGVATKVERGNRVFPQSDKSSDIIKAFSRALQQNGVEVRLNSQVTSLQKEEGGFVLSGNFGSERFDSVIVATGGYSYRATGCDGFGYGIAKQFGHEVVPIRAALCRILCSGTQHLEGVSLKNISVSFVGGGKTVSEFGEMLFTSDGISGPAVLSLSSKINLLDLKNGEICLDLKPALDEQTLDSRILRDFAVRMNKNFVNALDGLLPERLIEEVAKQSGVPFDKKVNQVTAAERHQLVSALKNLRFGNVSLDDVNFGIVTGGGVNVKQINPSTMQSKLVSGLYFAGEVLDLDALTGGFNIQIALSTGYVAGCSAAEIR